MGKATYTVTVTNNSNGVSVDYETEAPMTLLVPEVAAEVVKDLVNTVRFLRYRKRTRRLRLVRIL
ncbi:Putative cytoplasmic protein [Salmonella enterica subsp. enterica]|uniref:Cytoplasmic protein n=1 Tax=Salmonella enterica I TaxID=59201 RepID=A0A379UNH9_SALET|nr:Putative cytoplasmic protein [Salmonella enterica subsp. enterica]